MQKSSFSRDILMVLMKSRIGPLPKPCGKCAWLCLECGQVWDCFEEGGCRGDRLCICPSCWKNMGGPLLCDWGVVRLGLT